MTEQEQKIESRMSGKVLKVVFTDGEQKYQFKTGITDDYTNMIYGEKQFEECPLWWFPKEHKFTIQTTEGDYTVDYSQIDSDFISVSINDIPDKVLKIFDNE